jgi:hypothetical protein
LTSEYTKITKSNSKRTNNLINKWANEINRQLSDKEIQININMFNILSHKGNTNQNYSTIPSCFSQTGKHQENNNKCLQTYEEKGSLIQCYWNVN